MKAPLRRGLGLPLVLSFSLVAAFILFNGILAYQNTRRVYENGQASAASHLRLEASTELLSLIRDAETGQRGFVLTGQEPYLEPYTRATRDIEAQLRQLQHLGSLGPEEDRLLATMRSTVTTKMQELAETVALRREKGFEAARAVVLSDRDLQAMNEIRRTAAAIRDLEAREVARRTLETEESYRSAVVARALATLVGLALVLGVYRLSARAAAERARHAFVRNEQTERFRVTLSSIGDAVIVTDALGKIRFMNPVAERVTGWESDWEGQPVAGVFRIQDEGAAGPAGNDPVGRVLREKRIVGLENHTELVRRDGEIIPIDDSAAPILAADGALTGVVLVFRDITQRRTAERLVHSQKEALEEADRRKNEFLAMLAHELRNPLAALRNAIEVLGQAGADSPEGGQARGIIERQVRQMARMVDDLIDVARITSGRMTLRRSPIDIREIVEAAAETTASQIESRRHRLERRVPSEPLFVDGDAARLAQVLTNLLSNSARYTEPGGRIDLQVSRAAKSAVLSVGDNGMGITSDLLPHVFDMFRQGQRSSGASQSGLGIGLSLARRIIEMHGGIIEAESGGPGRGSRFVVTLPLAEVPERETSSPQESPAQAHRILIVEDNPDTLESLETFLRLSGHEAVGISEGALALAKAKRFRPTVALVDLGLPDVNGYDVARGLRAEPVLAGLHLVAVTGWAQEEDKQRSLGAGFDHHLVKPVEPEALLRLLAALPASVPPPG